MSIDPLSPSVLAEAGAARGDIVAVVVNATLTQTSNIGYLTMWPSGSDVPTASNLNVMGAHQTMANLATVPVGSDGRINAYAISGGHLILDVQGVYVASGPTASGRFVSLPPRRALDTRLISSPLGAGEIRSIDLTAAGVPASAAGAVLNVTVAEPAGPGYLTLWGPNVAQPVASNVNVDTAWQTRANQVISRVQNGRVNVFASVGAHLIVDVAGYYTGASASVSDVGLFRAVAPTRVIDSRLTRAYPVLAGETVVVDPVTQGVIPSTAQAVAMNATLVDAAAPGFLAAWPAGSHVPDVSSVNADFHGQTVANHVVVGVSGLGFAMYHRSGGHLISDIAGYFTGPGVAAPNKALDYNFLFGEDANGWPVSRWNPCFPITYIVDSHLASAAQVTALNNAIGKISAATGLTFQYVGAYDNSTNPSTWPSANAAIAFLAPSDPGLQGASGLGGGATYNGWIDLGFVYLSNSVTVEPYVTELAMHELGHMLGLAHAASTSEILYPMITTAGPYHQYGGGDHEGFRLLGSTMGCSRFAGPLVGGAVIEGDQHRSTFETLDVDAVVSHVDHVGHEH